MGYEVKMFIGHNSIGQYCMKRGKKDHSYFQVIAELDLCKSDTPFQSLTPTTKVFLFGLDGDIEYTEDKYGDTLMSYNPKDVLKLIKKEMKAEKLAHNLKYPEDKYVPYRRYEVAVAMLKTVIKTFKCDSVGVCFFGH